MRLNELFDEINPSNEEQSYEVFVEWYGADLLKIVSVRFDHQDKKIIIEVEDS